MAKGGVCKKARIPSYSRLFPDVPAFFEGEGEGGENVEGPKVGNLRLEKFGM